MDWHLECSDCGRRADAAAAPPPTVCTACGRPLLARYPGRSHPLAERDALPAHGGMWRFRSWMPITRDESPVSLGEGDTPLLRTGRLAAALNLDHVWIKDEGCNPTGSFKARGLSAAVTRAVHSGATQFVIPTAGNAGVASAAYSARAGASIRVYAPRATPRTILSQIVAFGAELVLLDGHIGDCGKAAAAFAATSGATDLSTLREPYRIEGKKTLALEIAMQLDWTMPDAIVYPAGGGTGLIGMWKGFHELRDAGWVTGSLPRLYVVQSTGCAPVVEAFDAGAASASAWPDPWTVASGLRVPSPLGDRLMLRAIRETGGRAIAVPDATMIELARFGTQQEGIDFSPEGGAAIAAALELARQGFFVRTTDRVVVFNTGAGWLYRDPNELPSGA